MRAPLLALLFGLSAPSLWAQSCNANAIGTVQIQCATAQKANDPGQVQTCQSSLGSLWTDCEKQYRVEGKPFPPPVTNQANPSRVVFNLLDQFGSEPQRKIYKDLEDKPKPQANLQAVIDDINRSPATGNRAAAADPTTGLMVAGSLTSADKGGAKTPASGKVAGETAADPSGGGGTAAVKKEADTAVQNNDFLGMVQAAGDYVKNGQPREAETLLGKMHELNPSDPQVLEARARLRINRGDAEGAKEDAMTILKLDPKNEMAQFLTGHGDTLSAAKGKIGRAKLDFGAEQDGQTPGPRAMGEARGLGAGGPGVHAEAAIQAAQARSPDGVSPLVAEGWTKFRIGDMKAAADMATQALIRNPADAGALALRAASYNRMGKPQLALADADAALKIRPDDMVALLERGYAKYQLARYQDALADVETALKLEPLNAMGHLYRAMILEKLDRVADSIASYLRAAELDPSLKPLTDDALSRLAGASGAPARQSARQSHLKLILWAIGALLALGLLIKGAMRAVKPEWATPVTPLR